MCSVLPSEQRYAHLHELAMLLCLVKNPVMYFGDCDLAEPERAALIKVLERQQARAIAEAEIPDAFNEFISSLRM